MFVDNKSNITIIIDDLLVSMVIDESANRVTLYLQLKESAEKNVTLYTNSFTCCS